MELWNDNDWIEVWGQIAFTKHTNTDICYNNSWAIIIDNWIIQIFISTNSLQLEYRYVHSHEKDDFCTFLWPPPLANSDMGAGLPVASLNFSCILVTDMVMDWDDAEEATCIECWFENEAASFGVISEGALDDCACEVVISSGWDAAEKGGVVGWRGENLGETLEWGDDGALSERFCKE